MPVARASSRETGLRALVRLAMGAALLLPAAGCKHRYEVGDHVMVAWEGKDYPAAIVETPSPSKYKVHYDGYDPIWDEIVPYDRLKGGAVEGAVPPEPPAKVRAKGVQAARTNQYKAYAKVRVEWHGQIYPATIIESVGQERYRIQYDGYGPEWNEVVDSSRIQTSR